MKLNKIKFGGFFPGNQQQSLVATFSSDQTKLSALELNLDALLSSYFNLLDKLKLNELITEKPNLIFKEKNTCLVLFPYHESIKMLCMEVVLTLTKITFNNINEPSRFSEINLDEVVESIKKKYLTRKNTTRIIYALSKERIPSIQLGPSILQIGWGKNSRLIDGSVSDTTSAISISIACNKKLTSDLLRAHGLPAPDSKLCTSLYYAKKVANQIGYPVVLKPIDTEGGLAVFAEIIDDASLEVAFKSASAVRKQILIEKHFYGNDYRIQIYKKSAYSVTHRKPGGVMADGENTIKSLINKLNKQRSIGGSDLRPIYFDDDAKLMLEKQKLTLNSKPAAGQFIQLRSVANVDRGGISEQVINKAHPENLILASRAAEILNLDIAGVDLIVPEISQSWRDTGALICEVNSSPMINKEALRKLFLLMQPSGYRIPSILVLCPYDLKEILETSKNYKYKIGISNSTGSWINGLQTSNFENEFLNGQTIMKNKEVQVIVNFANLSYFGDEKFLGFSCDSYDLIIFPNTSEVNIKSTDDNLLEKFILKNIREIAKTNKSIKSLTGKVLNLIINEMMEVN